MKQETLAKHIKKLSLKWTLLGVVITIMTSTFVFLIMVIGDSKRNLEVLSKTILSANRSEILEGGIRSLELQLKKELSLENEESLIFLDKNKRPWLQDLNSKSFSECNNSKYVCSDLIESKIKIFQPIYFDAEHKSIWGYLHIERNINYNWTVLATLTLIAILGMLFQIIGLYFNLNNSVNLLSEKLSLWALKISKNPKDYNSYNEVPYDEIKSIGLALSGLAKEVEMLESKAQQKGELITLRGVGHDILNPVSRMKRVLGILQCQEAGIEKNQMELLSILDSNLRRLSGYAEQLKVLYRTKTEDFKLNANSVTNVSLEISNLISELNHDQNSQKSNILIQSKIEDNCFINMPKSSLSRIVENICNNGIQASKNNSNLMIEVNSDNSNVNILITDNGQGIPKENLDKIFEANFTTRVNLGTGLGLFVVKKLVEEYSGKINLESILGKGTIFKISLPKFEVANEL